jgi:curved DNA-binding protein CbpA
MQNLPDYYEILSVPRDADSEQIKKAFKEKALHFHPDVNKNENAVEIFQLINLAYQTLMDTDLRRKYDLKLKYGQSFEVENTDIRYRHPADARYYERRKQNDNHTPSERTSKSLKWLNFFILYSITLALAVGIVLGFVDLFINFRIGGLLFSLVALLIIYSGLKIIRKDKRDQENRE